MNAALALVDKILKMVSVLKFLNAMIAPCLAVIKVTVIVEEQHVFVMMALKELTVLSN